LRKSNGTLETKEGQLFMATNSLVCPFLNHDPVYAYGVEFGILYTRMRNGAATVIEDYFCRANQDQILLLASRLRWRVTKMKRWGHDWLLLRLEQDSPEGDIPSGPPI
jgi:hypothetical protein